MEILWSISLIILARIIIYQLTKRPSIIIEKCNQTRTQLIDSIVGSTTSTVAKSTTYEELWIWVTKKGGFTV